MTLLTGRPAAANFVVGTEEKMMKRALVACCVWLAVAPLAGGDDRVDRLPQKYRDWLEKEVLYIIADREGDAFLDLESEQEWAAFIAAFWARRDPDPVTPVNELKQEHYRRIDYVNKYFGRESSVPGWMTDRGKMYIILGEPKDREEFTSVPFIYPAELWFYFADKEKGLPALYLLFWREHHSGPYRLFNHFLDDVEDLMPIQPYETDDPRREAYTVLQEINPELAHSAITMRADRGAGVGILQPATSGLDTQMLLSDIYASPSRRVDTRYVDAAQNAKGLVETEYIFNYVPNSGMANVLPGPGGTNFVHYAIEIEPRHMTLAKDTDKHIYYTTFELRGELTTPDGEEIVYSFTKEPYVQLTESQFQDVASRAFSYRDMFPVVEGSFRFRVVLKNRARTEYTIFETDVDVPQRTEGTRYLGEPMLLYGMGRIEPSGEEPSEPYRTYRVGFVTFDPNAKRTVAIGNHLMAHIPLEHVEPNDELLLRVVSQDEAAPEVITEESHRLDFYERPVVVRIPLNDAPGGRYRLIAELRDAGGTTIASRRADFAISPLVQINRPWALRDTIEGERLGLVQAVLAEQAIRLGQNEKGGELARRALMNDPNSVPARLMLARFHLDQSRPTDAIRLLEPARAQAPGNIEVLLALGDARLQVRHFTRASELFEAAARIRRPDTSLLNALGLCHSQLGNTEEAIGYLERSLEVDPAQEDVRSLLQQLKAPPGKR